MATILQFECRPGTRQKARRPGKGAEIVIFPGVRYERWSDEADLKPGKRRSSARRKKAGTN